MQALKICVMCRQNEAIHPDKPVCMSIICQIMYNERLGLYDKENPPTLNQCRKCGKYTTAKYKRCSRC